MKMTTVLKNGRLTLNDLWIKFNRSVDKVGKFPTSIEVLPNDTPKMLTAFDLFQSGCLGEVGKLLELSLPGGSKYSIQTLKSGVKKQIHDSASKKAGKYVGAKSKSSDSDQSSSKSSVKPKKGGNMKDVDKSQIRRCCACRRKETYTSAFINCEECQRDRYPDQQFYCSVTCKERAWEEHNIEHLEFSLGLSKFNCKDYD